MMSRFLALLCALLPATVCLAAPDPSNVKVSSLKPISEMAERNLGSTTVTKSSIAFASS